MIRTLMIALALLSLPAVAQDAGLSDAEVKARSEAIGKTLRCVVCQNQSIADSDASLAEDMRTLVEARVRAGDTDEDVRAYFQERYGDFVLMEPPVKTYTWLLWFGPLIFVAGGLIWYFFAIKKSPQTASSTDEELTPEEQARVKQILDEEGPNS